MFDNKIKEMENAKSNEGIHISRYAASWINVMGRRPRDKSGYYDFMESHGISDREADIAYNIVTCGKFELEEEIRKLYKK